MTGKHLDGICVHRFRLFVRPSGFGIISGFYIVATSSNCTSLILRLCFFVQYRFVSAPMEFGRIEDRVGDGGSMCVWGWGHFWKMLQVSDWFGGFFLLAKARREKVEGI